MGTIIRGWRRGLLQAAVIVSAVANFSDQRACAAEPGSDLAVTVQRAPVINSGRVEGSVQQLTGESVTLNAQATITSALLVPGTPALHINGNPAFGGTITGTGSAQPSNYSVTLNGNATLGNLITRTDPIALNPVNAPPAPAGTRDVTITQAGQNPGDFATLRNLTLNSNVGPIAVPPGTYGTFVANGGSTLVFGEANSPQPTVYNLQALTINGNSTLNVVGPIVLTTSQSITLNGNAGVQANPGWLALRISGGGVTLNGSGKLFGTVLAPSGHITLNGNGSIHGAVAANRLTLNGNGVIKFLQTSTNQSPAVVTAASANPNPATSTTTLLSVLGGDDTGEAGLNYAWATTGAPPAAVTFGANGTNAAKNTTATFTKAGAYVFQVTITDGGGLTATSSVNVTVNQTVTAVSVSPAAITVNLNGTKQFTASATDQFGAAMNPAPTFAWAVAGGGTIDAAGLFTAGAAAGGPFNLTATSGGVVGSAQVTVSDAPPTVATQAAANPNPVTGTQTALSVLGSDDGGEGGLSYMWAAVGTPPAAVTFAPNGTNAAKNSTATFTRSGSYDLQVSISDAQGLTAISAVTVIVNQTFTSIAVSPSNADVSLNGTQQFLAVANDQFAQALAAQPAMTWTVTGGGSINAAGLFTAGNAAGGPFTVTATSGAVSGTATVDVVDAPPSVVTAAAANPRPVTGTQTSLSVLGGDDGGEAALVYTWQVVGVVPAPVTFSENGTNAAKNTIAAFSKDGSYDFQVTISDAAAQTVVSTVMVAVNQALTSVVITPLQATVALNATQQFSVVANDQFGAPLATQPEVTWAVDGGGMISNAGLFTAGALPGAFIVSATSGTTTGTANIALQNATPTVATAASATPNPVLNAVVTTLSALGADDGGEATLTYTWSTTGVPPGPVTFSVNGTNASKSTVASFGNSGSYTFQVVVADTFGATVSSSVVVAVNQAPTVSAGQDRSVRMPNGLILLGQVADDGFPNPPGALTAAWSKVAGPGAVAFTNPNQSGTGVTFGAAGAYVLRLTASDSQLTSSSDVTITVAAAILPPVVDAGPDHTVALPAATSLNGTVQDDSQNGLTTTWTKVSGPANVSFANGSSPVTTCTFNGIGVHVLRLTASNGTYTSESEVTVTVLPATNRPPIVSAGPDQTVVFPAAVTLTGAVTDDGLPTPPGTLTSAWTKVSGPGTVTFANAAAPATSATFSESGTYVLRLTGSDTALTSSATVIIVVKPGNTAPVVTAGVNQTIRLPIDTCLLLGAAVDDQLPAPPGVLTYAWSKLNGPGNVTFENPSSATTTATFSAEGTYTLQLTASDSVLTGSSSVTIIVKPANQAPVVSAGPNKTLQLPGMPLPNPSFTLTRLAPLTTGPVGVDYLPSMGGMLVSVNYPTGEPHNFEVVKPDGTRTPFSAVHGMTQEIYFAVAPDAGNGTSLGGFTAGEVYSLNGAGGIIRISADGATVQSPWVVLPGETGTVGGVTFDTTGSFGGDMIVVLMSTGAVWRINSAGVPTKLGNYPAQLEGVTVAPNDPAKYGPWAGKILVGAKNNGVISIIDANGSRTTFTLPFATAESVQIVPPDQNLFVVDFSGSYLIGLSAATIGRFAGDILVSSEPPGSLHIIHWDGAQFTTTQLGTGLWEFGGGTAFASTGVGNIAPTSVTLTGTATDDGLPDPPNTLTLSWSKVSGPGDVVFSRPSALSTDARFSEGGTYVLRLTANDSDLSASSEVTVSANQAPKIQPSPNLTVTLPNTLTLNATVTDDGLPTPPALSYGWSKTSGPRPVTFSVPTYDANDDFALTNPSGSWSYGYTATRGSAFVPFTQAAPDFQIGSDWWLGPAVVPLVVHNRIGVPIPRSNFFLPPDMLLLEGGFAGENAVVRWTAPASGTYLIRGRFEAIEAATTDVCVLFNSSTTLFSADIKNRGSVAPFVLSKALNAGDHIDFSVGVGSNGNITADSTGLSATISLSSGPGTTASFTAPGLYMLQLAASDGQLGASEFVAVTVLPANQTPVVSAGGTQVISLPASATLSGTASDDGLPNPPATLTYAWSKTAGPGTVTFSNPTSLSSSATFSDAGVYVLRLSASDSQLTGTGDVTIYVSTDPPANTNVAPVVNPGPLSLNVTLSNPVVLNGTTTDDGLPSGVLNVSWTVVAGPGVVTFANAQSAATTAAFSAVGSYALQLSASDGAATTQSQLVTVNVVASGNLAPVVDAGPDQTITLPASATLAGTASDDAKPNPPNTLSFFWMKASGPGGVSFANVNGTPTASFSAPGVYVLRLIVSDSLLTSASEVTITAQAPNQAPVVAASPATQNIPQNGAATLSATASDDAQPDPLAYVWSATTTPPGGSVTFSHPTELNTTATFSAPGVYSLAFSADDGDLSSAAAVQVFVTTAAVNKAPVVSAGAGSTIRLPVNTASLQGSATDDGLPLLPGGPALTYAWTLASVSPVGGTVTFANATSASTTATFSQSGLYTLRLTVNDSALSNSATVKVRVFDPLTGTPPTASIDSLNVTHNGPVFSPAEGAELSAPADVVGTVSGGDWTLSYAPIDDPDNLPAEGFTTFAEGSGAVAGQTLGQFDPTLLLNGCYAIQLTATNSSGESAIASIAVVCEKNMKIGNFTLAFRDCAVPVGGLPIQVVRNYDSRDKRPGDFGVGWRLAMSDVRLQKSRNLGRSWAQFADFTSFLPRYSLEATKPHVVTITFPDGKVYKFEGRVVPGTQAAGPITAGTYSFAPIAPTVGTLRAVGRNDVFVVGIPEEQTPAVTSEIFTFGGVVYNPNVFELTTAEGMTLVIEQGKGLRSMTDLNGNRLTVTDNGYIHSSGKSVVFTRDGQGRITQITDPSGKVMRYAYDANNNLSSFTDATDNVTTFTYNNVHGLLSIVDPRGITPIRNEYDDDGRLLKHIDAFNKEIVYTHNIAGRHEQVQDRLGNTVSYTFDNNGNVLQMVDQEGGITNTTYDTRDNELSVTKLGANGEILAQVTYEYDPSDNRTAATNHLNERTEYTFAANRRVLTVKDPLLRVTENTYDQKNNLKTVKDAKNRITTYNYDYNINPSGGPLSVVNALTDTTAFFYDNVGNQTTVRDAFGHDSITVYDASSNVTAETTTRTVNGNTETLTTATEYDAQHRPVKTTFADATFTQIEYNAIGKQSLTRDQLGRETKHEYDELGRLKKTIYPDLQFEETTYDEEGRRLTSRDRTGRITSFEYDKTGRMTKTTFPDGKFTSTVYNKAGQVVESYDERNNVKKFKYDTSGRRTEVEDAFGKKTTYTYDKNGNVKTMMDANLHTTTHDYNELNQRIKTIFHDGTFTQTAYDELGRRISETDQDNKTTQFRYDKLSRLIEVEDALHHVTKYGYNEVGQQLTQTDARLKVTSYEYDSLGQRTKRTLPSGMFETYGYDSNGNMISRTDFIGRTTTYEYDNLNRLEKKIPPPVTGEPEVRFSYTATGQRMAMMDAHGTTNYTYDNQDRLLTKQTPNGTLTYTYDDAGNILTLRSSNANGVSMDYSYDALNRVSTATDNRRVHTTTYNFDDVGNLKDCTYGNGVAHTWTYDALNRLTNVTAAKGANLASYTYTLKTSGHRESVAELSGRTVAYAYDDIWRLTDETITNTAQSGASTYQYDAVGNRTSRTSTIPNVPNSSSTFDDNDRLNSDLYDENGNTTGSDGKAYRYDFENRLIGVNNGQIVILYDGDGNRISKTVNGVITKYLVDTNNHTGYAQVVEELTSANVVARVYAYGLDLISQDQPINNVWTQSFYGYDGHGSVRFLTDAQGLVTDTYDFDAFGILISQAGNTPNSYLYCGEQFDSDLGFYYLRARYMNAGTGRFWTMDSHEGSSGEPMTLHKYLYTANNPANLVDPSGKAFIGTVISTTVWALTSWSGGAIALRVGLGVGIALLDSYFADENPTAMGVGLTALMSVAAPIIPGKVAIAIGGFAVLDAVLKENWPSAIFRASLLGSGVALSKFLSTGFARSFGGRPGTHSTQLQNSRIAAYLASKGFRITGGGNAGPEEFVSGSNGKGFPDITATWTSPKTGKTYTLRVQTVTTKADNTPTIQEAHSAAKIIDARPNDLMLLVPKEPPALNNPLMVPPQPGGDE